MKKVLKIIDNGEEFFSSVLMIGVICTLFIQITSRYVFKMGQPWTEEVLRFSFLGLVYAASSLGVKKRGHFRVTFIIEMLPPIFKTISNIFMYIVWLTMNGMIIYYSFIYIKQMEVFPQISQILHINMKYIFMIIPAAFVLQTIRLIRNAYEDFFCPPKQDTDTWDEKVTKLGN